MNAAGFILLSPGKALADYISASVLFSMFAWLCLWVLPSVWEYRKDNVRDLRSLQVITMTIGAAVLLLVHPDVMGLIFLVLLVLEVVAFMPYLMLFQSRSDLLIKADFVRAMLNFCSLLLAIFLFKGSPSAYAAGLVVSLALVSGVLQVSGLYRSPKLRVSLGFDLFRRGVKAAFSSLAFRQLIGARLIEVAATLSFNAMGALGPILAIRAGSVAVQVSAFNARRLEWAHAIGLGACLYITGMATIFFFITYLPQWTPATLHEIGIKDSLIAFPPFLGMLVLTIRSIQTPKSRLVEGG